MPLLTDTSVVTSEPVTTPVVEPTPRPPRPDVDGYTQAALVTGDGQVWDLGDRGRHYVMAGLRGHDAPIYTPQSDRLAGVPGEYVTGWHPEPRDLVVPVWVRGDTRAEFLDRKRALLAALAPRHGLATLRLAEADGRARAFRCYRLRGGEGETTRDAAGRRWTKLLLELRCPNPYAFGDPVTVTFRQPDPVPWFPITPLRLVSSQVLGDVQVSVDGDVPSLPAWRIDGPANGVVELRGRLLPDGTAKRIRLRTLLLADQWIDVTTEPGQVDIRDHAGASRWGDLLEGSEFWAVEPGTSRIRVSVEGAVGGDGGSAVHLTYQPRYETS